MINKNEIVPESLSNSYMDIIDGKLDTPAQEKLALQDLSELEQKWQEIDPNLKLPSKEMITMLAHKCGISTEEIEKQPMPEFVKNISNEAKAKLLRLTAREK